MSFVRRHFKILAVAGSCAVLGAAASAIASAGAATTNSNASATAHAARVAHTRVALRRTLKGTVHGNLVVKTSSGFQNVTFDRGFVQTVSGQQLTIREGTKNATYKTVALTIPSNATVRDNHATATLGDVHAGQHVLVVQGPNRTLVIARDAK
jgi:hypothetical protein